MVVRNLTNPHNFSSLSLDNNNNANNNNNSDPFLSDTQSPPPLLNMDDSSNDNDLNQQQHQIKRASNPFIASDEEGYVNNSDSNSSIHYQKNANRENSEISLLHNTNNMNTNNNGVSEYKGYYSKNGSSVNNKLPENSFLLPPQQKSFPSSTSLSTGISTNDILSPPAFDRYPVVGSRVPSMIHGQQQNNNNNNNNQYSSSPNITKNSSSSPGIESKSSFVSNNPFLGEQDFSPFGGYPTSSFPLLKDEKEDDDHLHNPDPEEEARLDKRRFMDDFKNMDKKSFGGLMGIFLLFIAIIMIFIVLPALTFTGVTDHPDPVPQVIEYLTLYQYPQLSAIRTNLVDDDTPSNAYSRQALDGSYWKLVFSDEFNANGRTFYDGDDQYWTAPDIHYDATKDLEWYSPDASTTVNGTLKLRMDAYKNHNLYYRSGMIQSWNKLCFTQGIIEISANLPNYGRVTGLWPGLWTMGNLARPGFLASTEGVWPYSYESCDAGITPNQSSPDGISYLPGQKLSACTCDGEDHPNPGVGRGAPEIDIIEGEVDTVIGVGVASQSLQVAPFDIWYIPDYDYIEIYNFTTTVMNTYCGGPFQQAVSAVSTLNTTWYEFGPDAGYYQKYAIEYLNDNDDGYIRWFVGDTPTYTIYAKALHPNGNIGWRRISKEPMSIIMNLGISNNWAYIDWQYIFFPVTMSIDYVRIYQPNDTVSITCDPTDYPTYDYIQDHLVAYTNPNLTNWKDAGFTFPKNSLTGNCQSSKFKALS
ncbi:beta-glucan synthesis-associated protein KRE6 NDAI_0B05950 [Naumovozyma dairenensis CBS 421]|uniref:GH16 domain-containing protein n=1 Tax=Naumovozyma dairenensis (strain ATCC 10597 / BCRC 20456 / CBS 421 / NBRC 0211 / NRRL Y-12639) TaxID=1071378 RepID=G0W766_NAUDC|nr:hypothetical protein NDAI_0B05950 [Naumovozyma dairenensis CBS 421]CCD23627.1 hypothetical protein NDAI_0B05950 [Naumovozyma dairenensis CBS 421]